MTTFIEKIKGLREDYGVSQQELADLLSEISGEKCSKDQISNYETGRRQLPVSLLPAMAQVFKVSVDYLLGVEGNQEMLVEENIRLKKENKQLKEEVYRQKRFLLALSTDLDKKAKGLD